MPADSPKPALQKEDAVLRHLLRSVRSETVRRQFTTIPRREYTQTSDVGIMVSAAAGRRRWAALGRPQAPPRAARLEAAAAPAC
jgi:hypothetical protein